MTYFVSNYLTVNVERRKGSDSQLVAVFGIFHSFKVMLASCHTDIKLSERATHIALRF